MKFLTIFLRALKGFAAELIYSLGISTITFIGVDLLVDNFKSNILSNMNGVSADFLNLFFLCGGGEILNIAFGCLSFVIAYKAFTKFKLGKGAV